MKLNQENDDSLKSYITSLETEKLWEAYFFLKESLIKLPKISSYKLLYIMFNSFRDSEQPLLEYAKYAIRLMKKLSEEIIKRNQN